MWSEKTRPNASSAAGGNREGCWVRSIRMFMTSPLDRSTMLTYMLDPGDTKSQHG